MAIFLTEKYKVRNLSKRTRAALDTALEQYTYPYQFLLDWSKNNLATVEEKGQRGKNILDSL